MCPFLLLTKNPQSIMLLFVGSGFPEACSRLALLSTFFQDKEAKSGKPEKEKEAKEGSDLEEQGDLEGKDEEGPEDESETDYSSAEENILTKAGRRRCGAVGNRNRTLENVCLYFAGLPMLFYTVKFKISLFKSFLSSSLFSCHLVTVVPCRQS